MSAKKNSNVFSYLKIDLIITGVTHLYNILNIKIDILNLNVTHVVIFYIDTEFLL